VGKAYAMELARRGMNIVLISRSEDKLRSVAKEIESATGVETHVIAVDFSGGPEIYPRSVFFKQPINLINTHSYI
jgi:17beta-estradiol 17-dehydrogenase / very-long-chain 3-oxoacyl-CoA reductase